ncbi:MAG: GAF domain-containing protein [Ilumatobacteraceae bacterium]
MPSLAHESIRETQLAQTLVDLADALVGDFDVIELLTSITERGIEVVDAAIARLLLVDPSGELRVIARSSDAMGELELIELQSGEGPSWECVRTSRAVVNQDLATASIRWSRFAPAALDAGFHSAHAVPLRVRGTTFGALSFLRIDDARLDDGDVAAAQALADVATLAILQHRMALEELDQQLTDAFDSRVLIEQAAYMVAEAAGVAVEPAFGGLRNHARSSRFRLVDVAVDVMSGALPTATVSEPLHRRRASDDAVRPGRMSTRTRPTVKATMSTLSRAVEQLALDAGADATVIALFQRAPYFEPHAATYGELGASGATVVTAFAGAAPGAAGVAHVALEDADPLVQQWSVVLLTPTTAAHVIGNDLDALALDGHSMEQRRQFEASWAFDRIGAAAQARTVLLELGDRLPADTRDQIAAAVTLAEVTPTLRAERSLGHTALLLAGRLISTERRLADATARADAGTASSERDELTGLLNAEGLDRWLGGPALDDVPMPSIGIVLIEVDGVAEVAAAHGSDVGGRLLQAVAAALIAGTRSGDVVIRWGPTEFGVLCTGIAGDELTVVADRLVAAASGAAVDGIGVAASGTTETCAHRPLTMAGGRNPQGYRTAGD